MGKVWDCLVYAGLDDKVKSLPEKESTLLVPDVHQNAVALSGGEAQKLALARALYHNGTFFLLDEPTAALDPVAESEVYLCYHEMTAGKTAIFVSHRLASTQFCDRILVLDNAAIAEEGTHQELMEYGGVYAGMYEAQSRHYQEGVDKAWSI